MREYSLLEKGEQKSKSRAPSNPEQHIVTMAVEPQRVRS